MKYNHADDFFSESEKVVDIQKYLKSVHETQIISIEDNIRNHLKNNKKYNTLSEIQNHNKWGRPEGIMPDRAYTFDDIIKRVEQNPDKQFSVSDVWAPTSKIYVIKKFNRIPEVDKVIKNLNFTNCLNWEALDNPHYYLCKYKDMMILCSTIGGHRGTLVVLSEGFNSDIPCKVTYIGTLDIETVHGRCALIHHIDCNKRVNQGAEDRISSGVEANDLEFIEVMKDLLTCKLYVDKQQMKPSMIKGCRQISSWMNFKSSVKDYGFENVKWSVEQIISNTNDDEKIIAQAVETIACVKYHFQNDIKRIERVGEGDTFVEFLKDYFYLGNTQQDIRHHGKVVKDVVEIVNAYNKFVKRRYGVRYAPISSKRKFEVFGEELDI
tara:strand:+ start:1256 stop:2395 length:1140 start_codon:yes stop_codon:yes gene_type:complete